MLDALVFAAFLSAPRPQQPEPHEEPAAPDDGAADEDGVPVTLVIGRRAGDDVPVVPLDAIGARDVFGPERVRETGARDVNELVVHLPALSTRPYNGGEAAAPSFSMRGLPDDGLTEYVHVLIDGVPASPLPYGWTAFSFLPLTPERIHALDLVRGAHAVRYSPNTVGGILNFITEPIPDGPTLNTRSTFGSFDYSSNLITGGDTVGGVGWSASLVDRRGDGYRAGGGFDQQGRQRQGAGRARRRRLVGRLLHPYRERARRARGADARPVRAWTRSGTRARTTASRAAGVSSTSCTTTSAARAASGARASPGSRGPSAT